MKFQRFSIFILFFCIFTKNSYAQVKSYIYDDSPTEEVEIYLRHNIYSQHHIFKVHAQISKAKIIVQNKDNSDLYSTFVKYQLEKGDRLIFDVDQLKEFKVTIDNTPQKPENWFKRIFSNYKQELVESLYPCIIFTKKANEKKYGFLPKSIINKLKEIDYQNNVNLADLINYSVDPQLTVIYVILPKDRTKPGYVKIKSKNSWVKDENGQDLSFKISGISNKNYEEKTNYRIYSSTDTPQGIYLVNGVMKHSKRTDFGKGPYLDIDNITISPGRYSYFYDRLLYRSLLPEKANNDYWANEFNLAQALGRYGIRVHANKLQLSDNQSEMNNLEFIPTTGCLNLGKNKDKFMNILANLNLIDLENYPYQVEFKNGNIFSWNVSDKIGLLYLIVKNED